MDLRGARSPKAVNSDGLKLAKPDSSKQIFLSPGDILRAFRREVLRNEFIPVVGSLSENHRGKSVPF